MPKRTEPAGRAPGRSGTGAKSGKRTRTRKPPADYLLWLESHSMLAHAEVLADLVAGTHYQWQNAFAQPRPKDFVQRASVWFTSYPKSVVTAPDQSVLQTLGSEQLLATFHEIGIEGIHTGPVKRAGGISGHRFTPSVDGFFDRIELVVDPLYGSNDEYVDMARTAERFGVSIIGDLVPAHTGKGADFRLAERAYKNYEGLYTMVEIPDEDWALLPPVPAGQDSVNLSPEAVQLLEDRGYITGPLEIIPFYDPGIKDENWSATDVVVGADGRARRWVYLHVFKAGQPSFNWLDPTFGAQRIVMADTLQSLHVWGAKGLRLDANALIGIEGRAGLDKSWVEGHPLAVAGSNMMAMMIRKLGGHSFQELNLSLEDIREFSTWGPDLSYDFITRPAYFYALATGDVGPLRLMLRLMLEEGLDPGRFVHALQNHDELMFNLTHLRKHAAMKFQVDGRELSGRAIYDRMYERTRQVVVDGSNGIEEFTNLGFCSTLPAFAAAILGIDDPAVMTTSQRAEVQRLHLLAAAFNALQPGVFALSGWDLVGALLVRPQGSGPWLEDHDCRWNNRGAYDLMAVNPRARKSKNGMSRAPALYGSLPEQLQDPGSFASHLRRLLRARRDTRVAFAKLVAVPEVPRDGVLVTLAELVDHRGWAAVALNFGRGSVRSAVGLPQCAGLTADVVYSTHEGSAAAAQVSTDGTIRVQLRAMEAQVLVFR